MAMMSELTRKVVGGIIIAIGLVFLGLGFYAFVELGRIDVGAGWDKLESLTIIEVKFGAGNLNVTARNNGKVPVTVSEVMVNDVNQTFMMLAVPPHEQGATIISYFWTSGSQYKIELLSSKGNYFPYHAVAP